MKQLLTALVVGLLFGCSYAHVQFFNPQGKMICDATSSVVGTSEATITCGRLKYTTRDGGMSEQTAGALERIAEGAARGAAGGLTP